MSNCFQVKLRRTVKRKSGLDLQREQSAKIVDRSLRSKFKGPWEAKRKMSPYTDNKDGSSDIYLTITFTKIRGPKSDKIIEEHKAEILRNLQEVCDSPQWGDCKWIRVDPETSQPLPKEETKASSDVEFNKSISIQEIEIPSVLINGTNEEIEAHPAFEGIYQRGPHIRILCAAIQRMKDTNGAARHHTLLYGKPRAAKTHVFSALRKALPEGSHLRLNSNTTTKAGVEQLFKRLADGPGIPPIIFIEELEKTKEEMLDIWLGVMDDRQEIRKTNYRESWSLVANCLIFATANDKRKLDCFCGGNPDEPGALSSRFCHQLPVPRPDEAVMRRILQREIENHGGKSKWIDPCIDLAKEMETNDPRIVLGFLDGQDRLLTGEYQKDMMVIQEAANDGGTL